MNGESASKPLSVLHSPLSPAWVAPLAPGVGAVDAASLWRPIKPEDPADDNADKDSDDATPDERVDADPIDATGSGADPSAPDSEDAVDAVDGATSLDEIEGMILPDGVVATGDSGTTRVSPEAPADADTTSDIASDTTSRLVPGASDAGSRRRSEPPSKLARDPTSNDPTDTGPATNGAVSAAGSAGARWPLDVTSTVARCTGPAATDASSADPALRPATERSKGPVSPACPPPMPSAERATAAPPAACADEPDCGRPAPGA